MKTPMAANFAQVATLISVEPRFKPTTLIVVSRMMETTETICPASVSIRRIAEMEECAEAKGKDRSEVFGEAHGQCGDGAALSDGEYHPSVEESRELAIGLAQEDILPAGFGKHRSHLGEGEASQQRNQATGEPHSEEEQGVCTAEAIGAAVRNIPEPMMPPANSITESVQREAAHQRWPYGPSSWLVACAGMRHTQPMPRSSAAFQRRAADPADHGRTVTAREWIVNFASAVGTVECGAVWSSVGG